MSDLEKPPVESVPPDRKADIRKKVDRLSNMLQGSTSVSGILKARYQEALDRLKKQNTANQEVKKKIDELEKERERLKGQLEEQRKKGPVAGGGGPGQTGKPGDAEGEGTGASGAGGGPGSGGGGPGTGSGPGVGFEGITAEASGESKGLAQGGRGQGSEAAGSGTGLGAGGGTGEGLTSGNASGFGQGGEGGATGSGKGTGAGSATGLGLGNKDGSGSGIPQGNRDREKELKPEKPLDKSALGYPPQKEEEKSPELDPFKLEAQNRERELADLLKNTEAKIQAQKAEMERQSLAALNVQMLEAIKDNFKSLSKMISETAMTPERFRSMASSYGIGLDDQLVSSMMTSLPQASTERAALQEIKGYLDGIKGGSFGSPGEGTGVNVGGASGARGKFDKPPESLKKLRLDKDGEETEEGGDHVYTVIEKIENSKIDIHSKIYNGGLGVGPMAPMQGMPMGSPMEARMPPPDGKGKEGPAPGTVGPYYPPDLIEPESSEISPADDRRAGEDRRGKKPDRRKKPRREEEDAEPEEEEAKAEPEKPEGPEKKPEEDKEKSEAEKQAEKEKEEAEKKAAEEPPPPAFNPYNVSKEDDVFEEPKPVAPPAPPKPKEKKKPEEKDKDKAGGKDGKDNKKPEAKKDEKEKLEISLINDDYEKYGKYLKLTYLFDNMPNNLSYSKYKKALRNACRITLLGNLEEGLNLFNELKKQKLPLEYIEMIDKNIRDVKYYLRGKFRSSEADLE